MIAARLSIVMNIHDEIDQAIKDFRNPQCLKN